MPEIIYLNGTRVPREQAVVPIDDRGFLFGDAVYEVLRSYEGRVWASERHFRRLQRSLDETRITGVDCAALRALAEQAAAESEYPAAHIYVHVTRGVAPRALAHGEGLTPTVLVHVRDAMGMTKPSVYEGVRVVTRPDTRWARCDIKTTSLIANVLVRMEARRAGVYEVILYDAQEQITEAASMSVLMVEQGRLHTAPLGPEILPSISRELLLETARDIGIPVHEELITLTRLRRMDEVLLASTMHDVCPVVELDGAPVGDGKPGPVGRRLREAYLARIATGDDAVRG